MKTRIIALCSFMLFVTSNIFAQNEIDALRYSYNQYGGTARFVAMGGAFNALGGDFSAVGINPAGIGIYKKSEFTFTPGFYTTRTDSKYNNTNMEEAKYNFNINNIGMVLTYNNQYADKGFINGSLYFGVNKINNFHNRTLTEGYSEGTSLLKDCWQQYENGNDISTVSVLAMDVDLIEENINNPGPNDPKYYSATGNANVYQSKLTTSKGSQNEMVIGGGGNYSDMFYFGAALGVPFIKYEENSKYSETDKFDSISPFNSFELEENLKTTGTGINLKIGFIFRPIDYVRLGGSFQTPTFYALSDEWDTKMTSKFDDNSTLSSSALPGDFDYTLTTPFKANLGLAFILGKYGLISADYEFTDYSEARLRSDKYTFITENNNVQQKYTAANNLRFGAEARVNDNVALRGGYAMYGSPFKSNINDAAKTVISGGIGFREQYFFLDLTYALSQYKEKNYFYNPDLVNPAKNSTRAHSFLVTIGYKFY